MEQGERDWRLMAPSSHTSWRPGLTPPQSISQDHAALGRALPRNLGFSSSLPIPAGQTHPALARRPLRLGSKEQVPSVHRTTWGQSTLAPGPVGLWESQGGLDGWVQPLLSSQV